MMMNKSYANIFSSRTATARNSTTGFIALVSILLIGALTLLIAVGASLRSLGLGDTSFANESSYQADIFAESCVEHTLYILAVDPTYTGDETLPIGDESCHVSAVVVATSSEYTFVTESTIARYVQRISVDAVLSGSSTQIMSWRGVPSQ